MSGRETRELAEHADELPVRRRLILLSSGGRGGEASVCAERGASLVATSRRDAELSEHRLDVGALVDCDRAVGVMLDVHVL